MCGQVDGVLLVCACAQVYVHHTPRPTPHDTPHPTTPTHHHPSTPGMDHGVCALRMAPGLGAACWQQWGRMCAPVPVCVVQWISCYTSSEQMVGGQRATCHPRMRCTRNPLQPKAMWSTRHGRCCRSWWRGTTMWIPSRLLQGCAFCSKCSSRVGIGHSSRLAGCLIRIA